MPIMPTFSDPTDIEEPSSTLSDDPPEPIESGKPGSSEPSTQSKSCSSFLEVAPSTPRQKVVAIGEVAKNSSVSASPSLGTGSAVLVNSDQSQTQEGALQAHSDKVVPSSRIKFDHTVLGNETPLEPSLGAALLSDEPSVTHLSTVSLPPEPGDTHLTYASSLSEPSETHLSFASSLREPSGTHLTFASSLSELSGTHLTFASLLSEPSGTHLTFVSLLGEPSGTHSSPVSSSIKPNSTQFNSASTVNEPNSTHTRLNPPKLTGAFAKCSNPADFQKSKISHNSSCNSPSKLGSATDRVADSGRSSSGFLLVPILSVFLTVHVLRPVRHLLPESIRARLLSQTWPQRTQRRTHRQIPEHTPRDSTLTLTAMSGQLCFLTRYGPFNESLDDEVTFRTPTDRIDEADGSRGVDNFAFETDLLVEQESFTGPPITGSHLSNGVPKTFRSQVNESSSSSDGSFSSQESLTDVQVVPLGQPWRALGRFFNSTIVSVVILLLTVTVSLTLAGVSIFLVAPTPYFDKSLNAFQIPNHISTQRQLAFDAARKDDFHDLSKRSLDYTFKNWDSEDNGMLTSLLRQTDSEKEGFPEDDSNVNSVPAKLVLNDGFKHGRRKLHAAQLERPWRELGETKATPRRTRRAPRRVYRPTKWRIQLVYMAEGPDKNIFTKERLETIHEIEMSIVKHPNFTDFCSRNPLSYDDPALEPYKYCTPLNSLMTYFYPSEVDGKVVYDGVGANLADINGTLSHAMTQPTFYWFVDTDMNTNNRRSRFIRSEVWFGTPFGDGTVRLSGEETSRTYNDFLITYIDLLDQASTDKVRVLYGGNQLFDYEVAQTIAHDLRLSIPTGLAILLLLFILTSFSVWLTLWGFASILLSFAWAYFIYHVAFGKAALGLLNVVSGFVIIGIGVDDVFVFVNTYLQAEHYRDPAQRMAHTVKTAGTATFFTSFTTAGAFVANIASQIPAINDFGLFMSLIVSFCWILVALVMPCALTLWQRCFHCEVFIFRRCPKRTNDPAAAMATLSRVLDRHERQSAPQQQTSSSTSAGETNSGPGIRDGNSRAGLLDDNDIPMLDLEENASNQYLLTDDDEPLILTNDDNYSSAAALPARTPPKQTRTITKGLQVFLYRYAATPVIRGRWIVVLGYVMIFIASLVLVMHIKPAARPPALYNEGTNLQQLLDLAYNFSGKDISCKSCSGFSSSGPSNHHPDGGSPVTLPPVMPVPTTKRPTGGDHHAVTEHHGDVVTHKETPHHHDHGGPTPSFAHTHPPNVHMSTSHHHGVELTTTTTPVGRRTCADVNPTCRFGSSCVDGDLTQGPSCRCVFDCSHREDRVCGSDGQTYKNVCFLQSASCQRRQIIEVVFHTPCFDPHSSSSGGNTGGGGHSNTVQPGGGGSSGSPGSGYNPCPDGNCGKPATRPVLDRMALVYVVFGIDHLDRSNASQEHVMQDDTGKVIYDSDFDLLNEDTLRGLCRICKNLAARTELVTPGGAQCFPSDFASYINVLQVKFEECQDLPIPNLLSGTRSKSLARRHGSKVVWFAMAFESTTFMGKSSFAAYKDYNDWESAIQEAKGSLLDQQKPGLDTMFQTSTYWKQIFMEIVGVSSAIYGVAFSLLVCVIAVVVFTAHIGILLIAFLTIGGVIMVVVSMFYLLGWEMGAVEAVSLSIIVGSSIDYCIHLIEGYLVAGDMVPDSTNKSAAQLRRWRTRHSVSTIGVSILSSALTTIIASVPLCFTTIQLFAKFGKIVAMNTFVSILYTLTACTALLSIAGPARYRWNLKWFAFSAFVLCCLIGAIVAALFGLHTSGVSIPGPSGNPLF